MTRRDSYANGEFCWVDLAAHDAHAAAEFYAAVFGWSAIDRGPGGELTYAQFELDGSAVAGLGELTAEMKNMGIPPLWNSYVHVDDVAATVRRAQELGAAITVDVMEVPGAGKLAFFLDPAGTSLGLWENGGHAGAQRVSEPDCFCWNELATRDLDASMQFYGELLGWSFRAHEGAPSPYRVIVNAGRDNGGFLQMTEEWGDHPPYWGVYFAVTDVEAKAKAARAAGGKCLHGPFDTPVGPMAVLQDPQGAIFSVIRAGQGC